MKKAFKTYMENVQAEHAPKENVPVIDLTNELLASLDRNEERKKLADARARLHPELAQAICEMDEISEQSDAQLEDDDENEENDEDASENDAEDFSDAEQEEADLFTEYYLAHASFSSIIQ